MIYNLHRFLNVAARPVLYGWVCKILCFCRRIQIGRGLSADGMPSINVEKGATLKIGSCVAIRKDVEIRAHGSSEISIADNVRIDRGVRILAANNARVRIGDGVRIGLCSVLNGGADITIGAHSLISGFVYLQTSMHRHESLNVPIGDQGYRHAPVALGKDVWLGAHVVVLPGITIGDHAVIGSNAVVTKDIYAKQICVGIPAKALPERESRQ
jgi:acetyltransferase-like isoleucine patch superfamily enzyme